MTTDIQFQGDGIPIPHIHTLHSYIIKESTGILHFTGWYPIQEAREPTGTDLDLYESNFTLPQKMLMSLTEYVPAADLHTYIAYLIEITERTVIKNEPIGTEQILMFKILDRAYSST